MVPFDSLRGHYGLQTASEARFDPDLKSVTQNTYITMCVLLVWYGPF